MIVRGSALKHGVREEDGVNAATWPALALSLDDDNPGRQLRLGFDTSGRLLELIVLVWDDGTEELIHAMRARPQYVRLLG
ncbi:hypothetical protein [Microbacterium sp. SA39]|uniref:hypothetical protein n=1 Tax=Microbacterium sp. SA39 TaxID=1263625 RepID=UPI0005FA7B6B|nr:hypothetical protein [Microbacterium sp. SA39]KJQ52411.1 hypothetical protein RS85_03301 [Microbacterium sp. SA39]